MNQYRIRYTDDANRVHLQKRFSLALASEIYFDALAAGYKPRMKMHRVSDRKL